MDAVCVTNASTPPMISASPVALPGASIMSTFSPPSAAAFKAPMAATEASSSARSRMSAAASFAATRPDSEGPAISVPSTRT